MMRRLSLPRKPFCFYTWYKNLFLIALIEPVAPQQREGLKAKAGPTKPNKTHKRLYQNSKIEKSVKNTSNKIGMIVNFEKILTRFLMIFC